MFKFVKIKRHDIAFGTKDDSKIEVQWMCLIDEETFPFYLEEKTKQVALAYCDAKDTFHKHNGDPHFVYPRQGTAYVTYMTLRLGVEAGVEFKGIAQEVNYVHDKLIPPLCKTFDKFGKLVVNEVGGFMPWNDKFEVLDTIVRDKFAFPVKDDPNKEISISQWLSGGMHWYAKVGQLDVEDLEGNRKWNTKAEAEKEARAFIKRGKTGKDGREV